MNRNHVLIWIVGFFSFTSCSQDDNTNPGEAMLHISFIMDTNADRLDNFGEPIAIPPENAGQNPDFDILGLHFIGLYPNKFTAYDQGVTVFSSPTTEAGGIAAIDYSKELFLTQTDNSLHIPLKNITPGTYEYFRSSIGFQKYKIEYNLKGASSSPNWPDGISDDIDVVGTLASFLGYNTYIADYTLESETVEVHANKQQGYFGLETQGEVSGYSFTDITEGDAPQTTVPNPIDATSPVPQGSCVVTGKFPTALTIPQNATEDITIQVVLSINKSFEWKDENENGKYEPLLGEQVVDMGTRGVFPTVVP